RPEFSATERIWLKAFKTVAMRFEALVSMDDSYWLSFEALRKCHEKGKAGYRNYVSRACCRKHLDYVKRHRRTFPLPSDLVDTVDHFARVDIRLDLEDALSKLRVQNPQWEFVLQMRLAGHTHREIASELNVTERHAIRVTRAAEGQLRRLLASY